MANASTTPILRTAILPPPRHQAVLFVNFSCVGATPGWPCEGARSVTAQLRWSGGAEVGPRPPQPHFQSWTRAGGSSPTSLCRTCNLYSVPIVYGFALLLCMYSSTVPTVLESTVYGALQPDVQSPCNASVLTMPHPLPPRSPDYCERWSQIPSEPPPAGLSPASPLRTIPGE